MDEAPAAAPGSTPEVDENAAVSGDDEDPEQVKEPICFRLPRTWASLKYKVHGKYVIKTHEQTYYGF